ncbi:MAG TPA: hypothetical protein VJH88_05730 [Candidatus Nanoarchaeia archaeon]|nr:hypothetical protein [Candidatus Nanoarchaeia archaeon]
MVELDISCVRFSPKDRIKELVLPIKVSEKLAYVCGILAGDGSIYIREEKHDYVIKCVGNPTDENPSMTKF